MAVHVGLAPLVALCDRRLAKGAASTIAWIGALGAAAVCVGAAAWLHGEDPSFPLVGWLAGAARAVAWASLAPLALVIAATPATRAEQDGLAWIAAAHGHTPEALRRAELHAGLRVALRAVLVPLAAAALAFLFVAGKAATPVLAALPGVLLFGALAAVVTAGLGHACARAAGRHGPALLAALVFVPWLLSSVWAEPRASLPGALGALLDACVEAGAALAAGSGA